MVTERDLRVQTYAVAQLAGFKSSSDTAVALARVLERPFVGIMPSVVDQDRLRDRQRRREEKRPLRPQPGVDYGFAEEFNALWIVQESLPDFHPTSTWKPETWKEMFNRGKTLWNKISRFVRSPQGYVEWRRGHLLVSEDVFFQNVLSGERANRIAPLGFPIFGNVDGRVWIGITSEVGLFDERDSARRVERIQGSKGSPGAATVKSRAAVRRFRLNIARGLDVLILQIIASMELSGLTPAPDYVVQLVLASFAPNQPASDIARAYQYREAIYRLEGGGWISRSGHNGWQASISDAEIGLLEELPEWALENKSSLRLKDWQALLSSKVGLLATIGG